MKIIIDTKVDSKGDIKKAIKFLESISEGIYGENVTNVVEEKQGMFNMFSSENSGVDGSSESLDSPSVESYGNGTEEEESKTFNVKDMLEEY